MIGLTDFLADRRGGVSAIGVIGIGLSCLFAAIAIDLGALALRARALQGAADLAAMSAAISFSEASAAAQATAKENLAGEVQVITRLGRYTADRHLSPDARFVPDATAPNAVQVTLSQEAPLFFGRLLTGRPVTLVARSATAAVTGGTPVAMFSVGSRLASLRGGAANQLLSALAGSSIALTAMDYEALASAEVNLLQWSDALSAKLTTDPREYEALLSKQVPVATVLEALEPQLPAPSAAILEKIARATRTDLHIGELVGLEVAGEGDLRRGLNARVNVLDFLLAALETGRGGQQVAIDLGASAGLASVRANLAIGERPNRSPWLAVTGSNSPIIRTAQARLYVSARTSNSLAGLAQVNIPLLVELAASEARLEGIDCGVEPKVTLGVRPGIGRLAIGAIDESRLGDFRRSLTVSPGTLLSVAGLVSLTGRAEIEAADQGFSPVAFSGSEIAAARVKTVKTRGAVNGIVVSLFERLEVKASGAGLLLDLGGLARSLSTFLTPLGPVLDGLINPLLDFLGLGLGEADVRVHGVTCPGSSGRPVLVS